MALQHPSDEDYQKLVSEYNSLTPKQLAARKVMGALDCIWGDIQDMIGPANDAHTITEKKAMKVQAQAEKMTKSLRKRLARIIHY